MSQITYPLYFPPELYQEVKEAAEQTGLSIADTLRQAIKLGLPSLKSRLVAERIGKPSEMVDSLEAARAWFLKHSSGTLALCEFGAQGGSFSWVIVDNYQDAKSFFEPASARPGAASSDQKTLPASSAPVSRL